MAVDVSKLSPILFWDVDPETVTWANHRRWLLTRILERGTWEDWLEVENNTSLDELLDLEPDLKIEARERNFLRTRIRHLRAQ